MGLPLSASACAPCNVLFARARHVPRSHRHWPWRRAIVSPSIWSTPRLDLPSPDETVAFNFCDILSLPLACVAAVSANHHRPHDRLFIAPVETDLPHKDAPNRDVLSPSRSAIRRSAQTETRERRNPNRRAGVRILAMPHAHMRPPGMRRQSPWTDGDPERPRERLTPEQPFSRPVREALRDVTTRADQARRDRLEEQMSSIFGGTWHNIGDVSSLRREEAGDYGWLSSDARPRARRARVVAPDNPRRNQSPHGRRSYHTGRRSPPFRPMPDGVQSESATSNDETAQLAFSPQRSLRRNQSRMFRALLSRHSLQLGSPIPHPAPVDGLGDRNRSLSPEVWDTLLSTLTPDPQPPSVGSSFASAAASQSAGPPSAPPSAPGLADEATDPACESGHENSDDDEIYYGYPGYRSIGQQARRQRSNQPVPDYNLDGPSDGPHASRPEPSGSSASRRGNGPFLTHNYSLLWNNRQLSRAGSEDDGGADSLRPNSVGGLLGAQTWDEEWQGMQRIVRSLAAREDIPDDWWAEAGLNRTLPQDEAN
ncbi:hypothetical protein TARUN_5019 [Trichoderma arundinaceum]|uniref:Uncharacterized protein n=1 Tax=Trichoderma arundinaceum TaxID=490622 RepID=A0A395NMI9_TRIAR|nr:hypothetical protein TARUN_5019 [Trichoderma arundinaceum]